MKKWFTWKDKIRQINKKEINPVFDWYRNELSFNSDHTAIHEYDDSDTHLEKVFTCKYIYEWIPHAYRKCGS